MVNLIIDNLPVSVPDGTTIFDAARQTNIRIPTLCRYKLGTKVNEVASCRMCVVEVEGRPNLAPSCATPVTEGMKVTTNSKRVQASRRKLLQLILSDHPLDCLACAKLRIVNYNSWFGSSASIRTVPWRTFFVSNRSG